MVVASKNMGKIREFRSLLEPLGYRVLDLSAFPEIGEIEETGSTFAENALLKARVVAEHTGFPALADDSGLAVDALEGRPGIYSARYAGPGASDADNNRKLLEELAAWTAPGDRSGRYVCALVLYFPENGRILTAEADCPGQILTAPQGDGGFGYDPLFYLPELGMTFAQIPLAEKNKISHRGKALEELRNLLA